MTIAAAEPMHKLTSRQIHGRVSNEIAAMLRKRLTVPHIYFKAHVPGPEEIDILAVDRGGSGDVHGVDIKVLTLLPTRTGMRKLLAPVRALPVHYKYIAVQANEFSREKLLESRGYDELFDPSGIGRIGVITFDERLLQKSAEADADLLSVVVSPERFLLRGEKLSALEKFLAKAQPDMQVRI